MSLRLRDVLLIIPIVGVIALGVSLIGASNQTWAFSVACLSGISLLTYVGMEVRDRRRR